MKKIMFLVPSMRGGGAERVMSILVKFLDRSKFQITLVLVKAEGYYLDDLPDDIILVDLNASKARYSIPKLIKVIKKEKPDIIFSTLGHLNFIVALLKIFLDSKITLIARETSIVSYSLQINKYPNISEFLYKNFYNRFDNIICQSRYMMNDLVTNFGVYKEKISVINNPVDIDRVQRLSSVENEFFDNQKINLLAVGKLHKIKGYDKLIRAIKHLNDKKYHLTILGEGSEEESLKSLSKELDVDNQISFLGFQKNPYTYMKQADLFILSSWYEGFPNVVLEANTCGTPVVAFECPGGISEIIENGLNGFLVENGNFELLSDTIKKSSNYRFDESKITDFVYSRYNANMIIKNYEDAFSQVKI